MNYLPICELFKNNPQIKSFCRKMSELFVLERVQFPPSEIHNAKELRLMANEFEELLIFHQIINNGNA